MNALDYFLKANLYGLLFVGCYYALLRRHTFFGLNRAYLLASVLLSLTLPLVPLPGEAAEALPVPVGIMTLPAATVASAPAETGPDWERIALWAYGLVAGVLLLRLALRVWNLLRLISQSPRRAGDGYVVVLPNQSAGKESETPTFSFFHYVVLNPADVGNALILRHEWVHVRQWHSADVLLLAGLRALFWPCLPLILIDRALRQVHEFLADREAAQPTDYARFLVEYAFGIQPDVLTNGFFNPSLLNQRIRMLHRRATNRWALGKYVLILPLALGLLAMTTGPEQIKTALTPATTDSLTVTGRVTGTNGQPLVGVSIMDGVRVVQSDQTGRYRLSGLSKPATLLFSYLGHEPTQRRLTRSAVLNVSLRPVRTELPVMGATAAYKAVGLNPKMPISTDPASQTVNGEVFTQVEQNPTFPTGIPGLMQYVAHSLRYPARAKTAGVQGNVFVKFVVLPTGSVGSVNVLKGIGYGCDEEAARVVRQMPKWIPGRQNGRPVAVQYVLPIQFALDDADKRTGQISPPTPDTARKALTDMANRSKNARYGLYNDAKLGTNPAVTDSILKSAKSVHIRGRGPLGPLGGDPLYIIDGVVASADTFKRTRPDRIQTIEAMSDAKAAALYGERGKNGVVIITTRKP